MSSAWIVSLGPCIAMLHSDESVLVKRTRRDMVDDHIAIMERIAGPPAP